MYIIKKILKIYSIASDYFCYNFFKKKQLNELKKYYFFLKK